MIRNLFLISLLTAGFTAAHAQTHATRERVLQDYTQTIDVTLTPENVRCSAVGYSVPELKLSVPELKYITVFDHSNIGESQPCITAGRCAPDNQPSDLLGAGLPIYERVPVRVVLVENMRLDFAKGTCSRTLEERVSATIRGKAFTHLRAADMGVGPISRCGD